MSLYYQGLQWEKERSGLLKSIYFNRTNEEVKQFTYGHRFHIGSCKRPGALCTIHPHLQPSIPVGNNARQLGLWSRVVLGLNPDFTPYWLSFWASVSFPVKMRININLKRLLGGLEIVHIKYPGIWWMISKQQLFHWTFIDLGAGDTKMNNSQSTAPPSRSSQSSGKCKPRAAND